MNNQTPSPSDAMTELTQKHGYIDITESVKSYYTEGFDYLCVFRLPNGEPEYCKTPDDVLKLLENALAGIVHTLEIYVPSAETFIIARNGKAIDQWQRWEEEARQAAEPLVRERWSQYWDRATQQATQCRAAARLTDVMQPLPLPEKYYPCPRELQAKIVGSTP